MLKQNRSSSTVLIWIGTAALIMSSAVAESPVKLWEENVVLPTYLVGDPEPNPMFYFGRSSQGAEGRVYPYPLYDTLTGKKENKAYKMVYLENEYVKIGVLPEIGGRIFSGLDKTNGYDFFYRQSVIKPALIGLIGAWISGGVEWNVPHHHRASTFMPVQRRLEENEDGSKTVWVGELEVRHRMRWAVGYTLYPGRSYLEVSLRVVNRVPEVNTMLCFANVAVHVNEDYQVIFPPSTQYGTHHRKRQFVKWPIADSNYGFADFSKGVDVSWYKNHITPNSIFAWNYDDDFVAGYDHGKSAGTMAVGNHHVVPGKKLWTWGSGPMGRMWDHILTDEDGPYIEIMVGAYSDNQPDYSWLAPYETKSFEIYWYPFREIEGVKEANLDAAVNLEVGEREVTVGFYTTSAHQSATVLLKAGERILLEESVSIAPGNPYSKRVSVPTGLNEHDLTASISADGRELVAYSPVRLQPMEQPAAVKDPATPSEIQTIEELYLTGLWIEQFHNPSLEPAPYWEEALRRDPGDVRVNTALGIRYFKQARYAEAETRLRKALERLTSRHQTPKNAEATYYLGATLKAQGRTEEAFKALYKSTWNAPWRDPGYYLLAEITTSRGDLETALSLVNRSLEANASNIRALNLKAALLRHLARGDEARHLLVSAAHRADPLDVRSMTELWLLSGSSEDAEVLANNLREHPATGLETAAEYLSAGLWKDGATVLSHLEQSTPDKERIYPLVYYYLAYFSEKQGEKQKAAQYRKLAMRMPPDYVFPFQKEAELVLRQAMDLNPKDARAPYYLGNLLFDWQPAEAIKVWERSASIDPSFPIVHRNLAIARSHQKKGNSLKEAISSLEHAVALAEKYPIHFYELDLIYQAAGVHPEKRLKLMEENHDVVLERDDAVSRMIALKVTLGKYDDAIELMTGREFEVWEGGENNVGAFWTEAHLQRGHRHSAAGDYQKALSDYQTAGNIPSNLPSVLLGLLGRKIEIAYWTGVTHEAMGDIKQARETWRAVADLQPAETRWRRFLPPLTGSVERYYQTLSLRQLGREEESQEIFQELVNAANEILSQASGGLDSSAAVEQQQKERDRLSMAHYVAGLGYIGLNNAEKAKQELTAALNFSPDHVGARTTIAALNQD